MPGGRRPRVYVHIGEPKTGTTFLQRALWSNRARLAAQGILLPGYESRDHNRASRDLREAVREASDPTDPWTGDWDVLVGQALLAPEAAVISDEVLAACNPEQADRAVRSLLVGRGAHRPHRARPRDPAARRVAGDGQDPRHRRMGRMAQRCHRRPVGCRRPAPVAVLDVPRHAGHPRHVVAAPSAGPGARDHRAAAGPGQHALGQVRVGSRHRSRPHRPRRGVRQSLARAGRGRVPAPAERDAAGGDALLVLHPEHQADPRARRPGRAGAPGAAGRARQPGGVGRRAVGDPRRGLA